MTTNKVWLVTGAGRGMGVDIAKAALAAGYKVVASGRNTDKVAKALGKSADLLIVKIDITKPADAESAVKTALKAGCNRCRPRSNRLALIRSPSIRVSSELSFSRKNLQISQSGPLRTITSAERSKWNFGKATTVSSLATRPSSRGH